MRRRLNNLPQLAAVLIAAAALKLHYSTASVNELGWVLAPTALLVELATGVSFHFESYAGYMSGDHSFLIAASCSGVNFLIAAFLMLSLGKLWRDRSARAGWTFIPLAALAAYLTTIFANTVRIVVAMYVRQADSGLIWLNPDQLHRFEGIFVYFGFLVLLFIAAEGIRDRRARSHSDGFVRFLLPLAVYYATTLAVPLANGAYRRGVEFWEHMLFVLFVPLLVIAPALAVTCAGRRRQVSRVS